MNSLRLVAVSSNRNEKRAYGGEPIPRGVIAPSPVTTTLFISLYDFNNHHQTTITICYEMQIHAFRITQFRSARSLPVLETSLYLFRH